MSEKETQPATPAPKGKNAQLREWLLSDTVKAELAAASSGFLNGEHLANIMYLCVQKTPALQDATVSSIVNACKTLAAMQCEPDGINGWIVPRTTKDPNDKDKKVVTAVPIPSARGLLRMAGNNGITNLHIGVVRKGEPFTWQVQDGRFVMHHEPSWENSEWNLETSAADSAPLGYYVTWTDNSGYAHGARMSHTEVIAIMKRSDAYIGAEATRKKADIPQWKKDKAKTPWHTDFVQMALKTVIKRAAKQWSLPLPIATALAAADEAEFSSRRPVRIARGRTFSAAPAADEADPAALPSPEQDPAITPLETLVGEDIAEPVEA